MCDRTSSQFHRTVQCVISTELSSADNLSRLQLKAMMDVLLHIVILLSPMSCKAVSFINFGQTAIQMFMSF